MDKIKKLHNLLRDLVEEAEERASIDELHQVYRASKAKQLGDMYIDELKQYIFDTNSKIKLEDYK